MILCQNLAQNQVSKKETVSQSVGRLDAEMAELGDAADSKSAVPKGAWGFNSPSRHKGVDVPLAYS